jgi:hypothetical protein
LMRQAKQQWCIKPRSQQNENSGLPIVKSAAAGNTSNKFNGISHLLFTPRFAQLPVDPS